MVTSGAITPKSANKRLKSVSMVSVAAGVDRGNRAKSIRDAGTYQGSRLSARGGRFIETESDDENPLTHAETGMISSKFMKHRITMTSHAAVENFFATQFGQRLSPNELRWLTTAATEHRVGSLDDDAFDEHVDAARMDESDVATLSISLEKVLEFMREKKREFLILQTGAADGRRRGARSAHDSTEHDADMRQLFVELGGRMDGSGTADISALVDAAARHLRSVGGSRRGSVSAFSQGVIRGRRSTSGLHPVASFISMVPVGPASGVPPGSTPIPACSDAQPRNGGVTSSSANFASWASESDCDSDGDSAENGGTNGHSEMLAASLSTDQLASVQLRSVPRQVNYTDFVSSMQSLHDIASRSKDSGSPTTVHKANGAASHRAAVVIVPGTPTDDDLAAPLSENTLAPVAAAAAVTSSHGTVASSRGVHSALRSSVFFAAAAGAMMSHHPPAMGANVATEVSGSGGSHAAILMPLDPNNMMLNGENTDRRESLDDDGGRRQEGGGASTAVSSPSSSLRRRIDSCVAAFRANQTAVFSDVTLSRVCAAVEGNGSPADPIEPIRASGVTLSEERAAQKARWRQTTRPITSVMEIREKIKNEIAVLDALGTTADLDPPGGGVGLQRRPQSRPKSANCHTGPHASSRVITPQPQSIPRRGVTPNDFVADLAKHVNVCQDRERPASAALRRAKKMATGLAERVRPGAASQRWLRAVEDTIDRLDFSSVPDVPRRPISAITPTPSSSTPSHPSTKTMQPETRMLDHDTSVSQWDTTSASVHQAPITTAEAAPPAVGFESAHSMKLTACATPLEVSTGKRVHAQRTSQLRTAVETVRHQATWASSNRDKSKLRIHL